MNQDFIKDFVIEELKKLVQEQYELIDYTERYIEELEKQIKNLKSIINGGK